MFLNEKNTKSKSILTPEPKTKTNLCSYEEKKEKRKWPPESTGQIKMDLPILSQLANSEQLQTACANFARSLLMTSQAV